MTSDRDAQRAEAPVRRLSRRAGAAILLLVAAVVVLLGMLAVTIMERRWEAQRPAIVLQPVSAGEADSTVWGRNYPREYDTYRRTTLTDTRTKYGGADPRDYLEADPRQVILFAGYGFSRDYLQARGHAYAVEDVSKTKRIKTPFNPGTCWTCKSADVPRLMNQMGPTAFYAANWHDLKGEITHPIGCVDCHDADTMSLRVARPALGEAMALAGEDLDQATHQQMRSLVCAQCHVEYYFKTDEAAGVTNYLTFPWAEDAAGGARPRTVEAMIEYYDARNFVDYVHPVSRTPIIKAQHPDFEMYSTGIHAYRGVSCADCHMPYRSEGGVKFTDHHIQSPLFNIAASCAVCHRWSEAEIKSRVEAIQSKVHDARVAAEDALVKAHFDVAAAIQAGAADADLADARTLIRHAQFRWDYVSANNGMGFHSPQESMRILGDAVNGAQEARVAVARVLAGKGIAAAPRYPDTSTREKAFAVASAFVEGQGPRLLD